MTTVAIDSGSSYLKALTGARRVRFPASTMWISEHDRRPYADVIIVNGRRCVVGDTALALSPPEVSDPNDRVGFHGSAEQQAQICYAMHQLQVEDGEYEKLMVSLPYIDAQASLTVRRVCETRDYRWKDASGALRSVRFKDVAVLPQGVGALRRWQAAKEDTPSIIMMVDIGSCTLDIVMLSRAVSGSYHYHPGSTSSRSVHVSGFKQHWLDLLRRRDGIHQQRALNYHQLMHHAIQSTWQLPVKDGTVDLRDDYLATREWFTLEVKREVEAAERNAESVGQIVLTGGGAELVDILQTWRDSRVTKLDVWANVEGQYLTAMGAAQDRDKAAELLNAMEQNNG